MFRQLHARIAFDLARNALRADLWLTFFKFVEPQIQGKLNGRISNRSSAHWYIYLKHILLA